MTFWKIINQLFKKLYTLWEGKDNWHGMVGKFNMDFENILAHSPSQAFPVLVAIYKKEKNKKQKKWSLYIKSTQQKTINIFVTIVKIDQNYIALRFLL